MMKRVSSSSLVVVYDSNCFKYDSISFNDRFCIIASFDTIFNIAINTCACVKKYLK